MAIKKKTKPNQPRKLPQIPPDVYPFINPIIVTKDDGIIDGQHRACACEQMNRDIKAIVLDFNASEINTPEALNQIRQIQKEQSRKLERFFEKYNIGYTKQLELCSSEDRFEKFYTLKENFIAKGNYWETLAYVYNLCNNTYRFRKELKEAFSADIPGKEKLITQEARKVIDKLPNCITIFRGMSVSEDESNDFGISWTLNRKVAESFANTYFHNYDTQGQKHIVKEIKISKTDIISYFNERKEEEIIYIHTT